MAVVGPGRPALDADEGVVLLPAAAVDRDGRVSVSVEVRGVGGRGFGVGRVPQQEEWEQAMALRRRRPCPVEELVERRAFAMEQ